MQSTGARWTGKTQQKKLLGIIVHFLHSIVLLVQVEEMSNMTLLVMHRNVNLDLELMHPVGRDI